MNKIVLTPLLIGVLCIGVAGQARAPADGRIPPTVAALAQRIDARGGHDMEATASLAALFRRQPGLTDTVPELLRRGRVGDEASSTLIRVLEDVGNASAQRALVEIMADPSLRHQDRLRAVVAGGAVERPDADTVDALWRVARSRSSPRGVDISNTAILALGHAGDTLRRTQAQRYDPLRAGLVTSLRVTPDPLERSLLLKALGNTNDPSLADDAAAHLADTSAPVRASAAQALGLMGSQDSLDLLTDLLVQEPRGAVRVAILDSLARLQASERSLQAVHARVLVEAHPEARARMVAYLGEHLDELPTARRTLESLMTGDPSQRVRMAAAEALYR